MTRIRPLRTAALCGALALAPLHLALGQADSVRRLADAGLAQEAWSLGRAAARARPDDPTALAALTIGALAAGRYDVAVEAADELLALAPDVSAHRLLLGQAYLSHARAHASLGAIGKVKKGRAAVEEAIRLDPDNLEARHTLLQFLLQAPGIAGGSREGAREQAREIARRDGVRGLRARLEIAGATGEREELRAVFDDALPVVTASPAAATPLLGDLLGTAAGLEDDRLREELTNGVYEAAPDHPLAAYHRARLWIIEGERLVEAERLLLRYLAGPEQRGGAASRAGAHWRLAQLYERQDREDRAREQYRLAATLDPRLRPGRRLSPRLEAQL